MTNETGSQPTRPSRGTRHISPKQIIGLIVLAVFIVFIAENTRRVPVRLIGPEVHTSLAVALLISAVLGAAAILLVQQRRRHR